jgi:Fe2+ or Zn2+ uptake regulation protein
MMGEKEQNDENQKNYKDFITFTPDNVRFISRNTKELADKHYKIVKSLRKKPMTVKELHSLFYNKETRKYSRTRKTIYRYLDRLENAGIVTVVGHRITDGSRVAEKLYARTAKVFFMENIEITPELRKKEANTLMRFFSKIFLVEKGKEESLSVLLNKFLEIQPKYIKRLFNQTKEDHELAELIAQTDIDTLQCLSDFTGTFAFFVTNSDIMDQIKDILHVRK